MKYHEQTEMKEKAEYRQVKDTGTWEFEVLLARRSRIHAEHQLPPWHRPAAKVESRGPALGSPKATRCFFPPPTAPAHKQTGPTLRSALQIVNPRLQSLLP